MRASTAKQVLGAAASEIGYTENPAGSNRQKFAGESGTPNGVSWCAEFVSAIFKRCKVPAPMTASVAVMEEYFRDNNRFDGLPRTGDIVTYDWEDGGITTDHIGFVESVNANGSLVTIEGNTSPDDNGSQTNGGGVYRRHRPRTFVRGFGHPEYEEDFLASLTDQEKADLLAAAKVINAQVQRSPGDTTLYQAVTSKHPDGHSYRTLDEVLVLLNRIAKKLGA